MASPELSLALAKGGGILADGTVTRFYSTTLALNK